MNAKIDIYTDGGCADNGYKNAVGAWAFVVTNGTKVVSKCGGEQQTTNNRMELKAVINAIEYFMKMKIDHSTARLRIFSDSSYVVNSINQRWIKKWIANGWITAKGSSVENKDLFVILNDLDKKVDFQIVKVKGHGGNALNEECDRLCTETIKHLKNQYSD